MNSQQDDFADLRRLLALKRHEQPPPGYFHRFSGQVIARIQAGESGEASSWMNALALRFRRFWRSLETKPVLAGGFGLAVCGVLLAGLFVSEPADPAMANPQAASISLEPPSAYASQAPVLGTSLGFEPVLAPQPRGSLFQKLKESQRAQAILIKGTSN